MSAYKCKLRYLGAVFVIGLIMSVGIRPIHAASYQMLTELGTSAEMIRRGNIEGFGFGANSVFDNPAGLYRTKHVSATAFASTLMTEVEYRNAAVSIKTVYGDIGVGYMESGVDGIKRTVQTDEGNIVTGDTFSSMRREVFLGYNLSITKSLHVGVSATGYLYDVYNYRATGYGLNAGLMYQFSDLEISIFSRNIIPLKVSFSNVEDSSYTGEEELPLQTMVGIMYPFGDLRIRGQFRYDSINTLLAGSLEYSPSFLWHIVEISAGYKEFSVMADVSSTITMGVGLNLFGVHLDYAYEQSDHFEYESNTFASVGFNF